MAKNVPTTAEVSAAFRLIADWVDAGNSLPSGESTSPAAEVETLDEDETRALPIKDLRSLAVDLGLDEQKVKTGILAELEAKGYFGEADEDEEDEELEEDELDEDGDEEEDEGDEEDEDEEEEEELGREELEEMPLAELRKLAKSEGHNAADYRGKDKDALVDLILGEGDEDDEDEDDEDVEEEEIDEDALNAMDLPQLKKVAADLDLNIPSRISKNKAKIVAFILENAAEEE